MANTGLVEPGDLMNVVTWQSGAMVAIQHQAFLIEVVRVRSEIRALNRLEKGAAGV